MMNPTTKMHVRASTAINAFFDSEDGASMVEYAFLIALIAIIALVAVAFMGQALDAKYDSIGQSIANT